MAGTPLSQTHIFKRESSNDGLDDGSAAGVHGVGEDRVAPDTLRHQMVQRLKKWWAKKEPERKGQWLCAAHVQDEEGVTTWCLQPRVMTVICRHFGCKT